jgi:archaellum component FlaC
LAQRSAAICPIRASCFRLLLALLTAPPCSALALDLSIGTVPLDPSTNTPQITNLDTLKTYHLKDLETAQSLQVSCYVYANITCNGDPINTICEALPGTVRVRYELIDGSNTVWRTVEAVYNPSWTGQVFDDFFEIHYSHTPSSTLSLAGLNLTNQEYFVKATVDPLGAIAESNEGNNESTSDDSFFYRIYSGILNYGPIVTHLTTLGFSGLCIFPDAPLANTAVAEWTHEWGTTVFNPSNSCYPPSTNVDGYSVDLTTPGGAPAVNIGTLTGTTPSGLVGELRNVTLDGAGAHFSGAAVYLADNATVHTLKTPGVPTDGFWPCGGNKIDFSSASGDFTNIYDIGEFALGDPRFYHGYGLPFNLYATDAKFRLSAPLGIRLENVVAMHAHFPSYYNLNPKDPRGLTKQRKGFPSNDVVFMAGDPGHITTAIIDASGIDASDLGFLDNTSILATPRTSFPQGKIYWNQPFVSKVEDNVLEPQALPVTVFRMRARQTCPDDSCGDYEPPESYDVQMDDAMTWMTSDGSQGSGFVALGENSEWGKWESGDPTFRRDDSAKAGVFYLPGFYMRGTDDETVRTVSQVLLGSRLFDGSGSNPDTLTPLLDGGGGSNADVGNGFYAGLNMGPEKLETLAQGSGQLLSASQNIRFNGNLSYSPFDITNYTKYFLRPSGVTGVFNTSFMGILNIYGYDIDFRRFAFRQVYNKLDTKTFLDGTLDIPYPCDITVYFLSLQLTCSGDLSAGTVDTEPETDWKHPDGADNDSDGFTDEGNQVLSYWKTPIAITGMAFVPTLNSGDPCLDNTKKELQLITLNDVNGIEKFVTMQSIYPVNGKLKNQTLTSAAENTYDKPLAGSDPGFSVRLAKAYLNQLASYPMGHDGFLNLAGLTDVPLFNDIESFLQLDNPMPVGLELPDESFDIHVFKDESSADADKDGIPDAYGTNVTNYRNLLANGDDAPESGDPRPRAKYSWPASGLLNLNYALTYNRSNGADMPQFLGIKKVYNLVSDSNPVITITTVPDYLNPLKTKFSFGVSADFAAIANFQVNLNDLGDIDNFLHTYLGVDMSFSLEAIFNNVLDAENIVHNITGGDLTQVLRPIVDAALDSGPVDSVINDFADAIGQVNRIPQEVSVRTADVLDGFRAQLLDQITAGAAPLAGAGGQLQNLFDQLAPYLAAPEDIVNSYPGNPYNAAQQVDFAMQLQQLRDSLAVVENTLNDVHNGISTAKDQVNTLANDLDTALADVNTLLTTIKNTIIDPAGALGNFTNLSGNPIIQKVDEVKGTVQDVIDAIHSVDLGAIASALQAAASLAGASIDTSQLDDIQNTINSVTNSLEEIIQKANMLLQAQYASMPTLFNDAKTLLDQVSSSVNMVNTQLDAAQSLITGYMDDADMQVTALKGTVSSLRELLTADLPDPDMAVLPDYNALLDRGREKLNDLAMQMVSDLLAQFPSGLLHTELLNIQALITGDPTMAFNNAFRDALNTLIDVPLKQAQEAITNELTMILDQALSVIPTPDADDIKGIIRNAILNSQPVKDLNKAFFDLLSPISDSVDQIASQFTTSINDLIQKAIKAISDGLNAAIDSVTSGIADFDLVGGRLDGYAIVNQEELEQIHIEAEFTFGGDPDPTTYFAALDITSWNSENGKGACVSDGKGLMDAVISTHDISADMLGLPIGIKEAALGFTLDGGIPIGIFGHVYTSGELNFEAVVIRDMGLEFGMGLIENYLGATAAGKFESYTINKLAFYFGKTCDFGVLERLDPEVASFIGPMVPLIGVYVRGSVSVPIINFGCPLTIGAGVDVGVWYLSNSFGGLFGGSVYGEAICLVSIKGKVTLIGQKLGDDYNFQGNGWIAGGIGFCEPEDWNSLGDVRDDDWCATGDASFGATYSTATNDFSLIGPDFSCCD